MSEGRVSIFYNGSDAFLPQPTPFVGIEEQNVYAGELWAKQETVTLEGQLTGCTFELITAAQENLRRNFARSYQSLEVIQQDSSFSGVVFRKDLVEVDSISFASNAWRGVMPYTIKLRCYPSGYFSGAFGVLEPKDTWAYSEQQNHTTQITHTISCRGINTSSGPSNALSNAINWVNAKRGTATSVNPAFIEYVNPNHFCLITSAENPDRFNGTYAVTDTYTNDNTRTGYGVLRYSASIDSGDATINVNLQGEVRGCNRDIDSVRAAFQSFNPLGAALFLYSGAYQLTDLNPNPVSKSIQEDPYNAVLSFNYQYDNYEGPETYFDYTVSVSSGNAIGVSIVGEVLSRAGDVRNNLIRAKAFAATVDLYQLCIPFYNAFYPPALSFPLNPKPVTSGISISETKGTVTLNADFTNEAAFNSVLDRFDFTLDFGPATEKFDLQPVLDGQGVYSLVDLGYANRAVFAVKGAAIVNKLATPEAGEAAVRAAAQQLFGQYGRAVNATLDRNNLSSERTDKRALSFDFAWSFDAASKVSSDPYLTIDTLSVS